MSSEYERFRRGLEEQLRADVELLHEAYRVKLRALETVFRARGELAAGERTDLPAAPRFDVVASDTGLRAETPLAATAGNPGSAPPRRSKGKAHAVHDAVESVLAHLPEVFDRDDVRRQLDFEPRRTTLHRVLRDLVDEGRLALHARGSGRYPARYRQIGRSTDGFGSGPFSDPNG